MADSRLRDAIESLGGALKDWTVMAPQRDPFRLDKPAGHRDGQWLADRIAALRLLMPMHLRGLHYALIGQPKPNGLPYTNTERDWGWLNDHPAKCARWLGYIGFDQIIDERSDEPVVIEYEPPGERRKRAFVATEFKLPTDLTPYPDIGGLDQGQPYHLVLVAEKTSTRPVLGGVAQRYGADLYLETGDVSDDHIYRIARSSEDDPRPMVILYFADCDPSGYQMGVVLSRKLAAHKLREFAELDFQVHRAALTPAQVQRYGLPYTPLKTTERRAEAWVTAMGVEQTEIDALAALQPQRLRDIAQAAIAPFYDSSLRSRVYRAENEWEQEARQAIADQLDDDAWTAHTTRLARIRRLLDDLMERVEADADDIDLPEMPEPIEAELDLDEQPEPLCDSRWDFAEQTRRLLASKNYEDEP